MKTVNSVRALKDQCKKQRIQNGSSNMLAIYISIYKTELKLKPHGFYIVLIICACNSLQEPK